MKNKDGKLVATESNTILQRLACPECRGMLSENGPSSIRCDGCGKTYRYRDNVPYMLDETHTSFNETRYSTESKGRLGWIKSSGIYQAYLRAMEALTPLDRNHPLRYMPVLKEFLKTKRNDRPWFVLDVGGGDGRYKSYLTRPSDEYAILEVDETNERVRQGKEGFRYIIGNAHQIPMRDAQVDLVALTEVLEHVYNPFEVMKECARVLRPGGVLFLTTPQYWHIHGWPSDYFRYTIYGLRHLLAVNGLRAVKEISRGGPFTVVSLAMVINFNRFFMFPPIRIFVTIPFIWLGSALDGLFFKDVMSMKNPDTAGWVVIAEKI